MNVTVFGATGGVASQVVEQLRSRGHSVTAYVRNLNKIPSSWSDDVTVVTGELSDAALALECGPGAAELRPPLAGARHSSRSITSTSSSSDALADGMGAPRTSCSTSAGV